MLDIVSVVGRVGNPLRSYEFVVELPVIGVGSVEQVERLKYMVRSVSVPSHIVVETEKMKIAPGYDIEYPIGFRVDDKVVIEFWEDDELSVYRYFWNWRQRVIYINTESEWLADIGFRSEYAKDVRIGILDSRTGVVKRRIWVKEAFPVMVERLDFNYGDSDVVRIRVQFAYKNIII